MTATKLSTDRFDDPMYRRRLDVLTKSEMHRDAVQICQLAQRLEAAVDDFIYSYSPDTSFDLFVKAKCHLPSDISEQGMDENRDWSGLVHNDVSGFHWGLKAFLAFLTSNLVMPDEEETADAADQEGEDVEPGVVVVG